jgi:hypothetical protein
VTAEGLLVTKQNNRNHNIMRLLNSCPETEIRPCVFLLAVFFEHVGLAEKRASTCVDNIFVSELSRFLETVSYGEEAELPAFFRLLLSKSVSIMVSNTTRVREDLDRESDASVDYLSSVAMSYMAFLRVILAVIQSSLVVCLRMGVSLDSELLLNRISSTGCIILEMMKRSMHNRSDEYQALRVEVIDILLHVTWMSLVGQDSSGSTISSNSVLDPSRPRSDISQRSIDTFLSTWKWLKSSHALLSSDRFHPEYWSLSFQFLLLKLSRRLLYKNCSLVENSGAGVCYASETTYCDEARSLLEEQIAWLELLLYVFC